MKAFVGEQFIHLHPKSLSFGFLRGIEAAPYFQPELPFLNPFAGDVGS